LAFLPQEGKSGVKIENDYRIETFNNSPASVVINGFYPKTRASEGAEKMLSTCSVLNQLAALALVINQFFIPTVLYIE
jgi:hypothetical protein